MDPRLKAYQKQARAVPLVPADEAPVAQPVVRAPLLAQFPLPPEPKAKPKAVPEALVKTTAEETPASPKGESMAARQGPGPAASDKSLRKVAKFLILLGQDEAAKVVRHLDPGQIEALGVEIAGIKKIEPIEAEAILKEFGYIATQQATTVKGGQAMAKAILSQAFGADQAKAILHKAVPHSAEKPFTFFAGLEPAIVQALLGHEAAQVLSIVLPFLEKAQAAAFLKSLDAGRRLDLVKRLAKMERVPSTVVAQVETALRERFHNLKPSNTEAVDGRARLADILRHLSVEKEDAILKSLDKTQPAITEDLRRRLFTVADLVRVADEGFEELLRSRDDARVALLWLAGDVPLQAKISANVSARRLLLIRAEADLLSDTPKRELQKELRFFLEEVREAVREGRAALLDDSEEYV
jgi:flagellar motor switch protein FliG